MSLAALEVFVHLDRDEAPGDLVAIPADVPTSLKTASVDIAQLPAAWRTYPAPSVLADLGTAWIRKGTTAVLIVPSAVIPSERNYLLNPAHPGFRNIRVGRSQPFSLDPRMWKAKPTG